MDNRKGAGVFKKISVYGVVQGVGFRPFVYNLAKKHNIKGTVRNLGGIVEIYTQSTPDNFVSFFYELKSTNLMGAEVAHIEVEDTFESEFDDFKIIRSNIHNDIKIIPADLPTCSKCAKELNTINNRRYKNPFISCMSCGPRYSIIKTMPYDRENTTMVDFEMCDECTHEYNKSNNRRFYAQTISCNDCGPYLIAKIKDKVYTESEALQKAVNIINEGGIVAVKGIGGFHFACSALNESAVNNLRKVKNRDEKPFAVMFDSVNSIKKYCTVSREEEKQLKSAARPIVLLYNKTIAQNAIPYAVGKGSSYCGAFLPYTPLQIMLTEKCGALVMTSANISNEPIIKDNAVMLKTESPYIDCVLYHNRDILRSVDDSVVSIIDKNIHMIRRSRGYVPQPIFVKCKKDISILAAGGDLKASFCLYKNNHAFLSQYFGDLEEEKTHKIYKESILDLQMLLNIKPQLAVCDMHPNYFSSQFAKLICNDVLLVQHHHAHIASVMAEHNLYEKVIGVAFDGTGYGTDGSIWGGEFLICSGAEFVRTGHLSYTPVLGGDSLAKDAKKTATCFLLNAGLYEYIDDTDKDIIKSALEHKINTVLTSSMGRLFDAVSAILDIETKNVYEGKCAIELEKEALTAIRNKTKPYKLKFEIEDESDIIKINPNGLLREICSSKNNTDKSALALGFHYAVSNAILDVCRIIREKQSCSKVALSGGVFQNRILTERTIKLLKKSNFEVFYNSKVPSNDGGISLGQAYIGLMR